MIAATKRVFRWLTRADEKAKEREAARRRAIRSEAGRKSWETRRRNLSFPSLPTDGAPDAADMRLEAGDARDAMNESMNDR